jgi:gliding motility-associated-like protein
MRNILSKYCLILLLGIAFHSFGQSENDIWHFGFGAGLDFSSGSPVPFSGSEMFSKEGCASISDANGQLLFYTNGLEVWNRNDEMMPNGFELLGGSETSATNQAVIVPFPEQSNRYFIFTADERAGGNGIHYSIIDMTLENGLGDILQKNISLYQPSTERIALARHSNGTDFWLITHAWNSNEFRTYHISQEGIDHQPIISSIGSIHTTVQANNLNARGMMQVSPDGNQLAVAIYTNHKIELFQFNSCDGTIIQPITITGIQNPYGIAFSPNSQLLYISNLEGKLYQYQVVNQTLTLVGETSSQHLGAIQQASDDKLYVAIPSSSQIGVINEPNANGLSCDYQDASIDLGTGVSAEGLPSRLPSISSFVPTSFVNPSIDLSSNCQGEEIEFTIQADEDVTKTVWQFQGLTSTDLTTQFTISDTGSYPILAIFSNDCKADSLQDTIQIVNCEDPLFVPNAFSPNHDGENDTWQIYGRIDRIEAFEMMIFSRWGDRIFYSTSPTDHWTGHFRGQELEEGVYVWMIKVKFQGIADEKVLSGDLTLLR